MAGAKTVGGGFDTRTLARAFVHSLVPIAAVYVAAHYLTFLIFEGQAIRYTASDPFGQGWDLFGWASAGINYGVLCQNAAWYLQVGLVVARARRRARTGARPRAVTLRSAPVGGALAILDAGNHDRVHDARAVAARAGGVIVSARAHWSRSRSARDRLRRRRRATPAAPGESALAAAGRLLQEAAVREHARHRPGDRRLPADDQQGLLADRHGRQQGHPRSRARSPPAGKTSHRRHVPGDPQHRPRQAARLRPPRQRRRRCRTSSA